MKKNHTRIENDDRPTRVGEVVDFLMEDVKTAQSSTGQAKLVKEDVYVAKANKHVGFTSNGDSLLQFAYDHPIALQGVPNRCMRNNEPCFEEVVRVQTIKLAASEPTSDTTFLTKWSKRVNSKIPKLRKYTLKAVEHWWTSSPELEEFTRATKLLAFFKLMLMCTAPTIYHSDHWIQYITVSGWFDAHWENAILDELKQLQLSNRFLTNEASILQLKEEDGAQKLVTILSVNTNGIKKNGHLVIQHILSTYALCCVQDTRFRDRQHLETFYSHLTSTFGNKSFASDSNSLHSHPVRESGNGVMAIIRNDFPGLQTAETIQRLTIQDRCLVVRLVVDGSPVYIHNVYSPVNSAERKPFYDQLPTVWIVQVVPIDKSKVDFHVWNCFPPWGSSMLGVNSILKNESLLDLNQDDSSYASLPHKGDHLAHILEFASPSQLQGRGYWKCPLSLFEYPVIRAATEVEADHILERLYGSSCPGKDWER
uniref:AlNc14C59G4392 protein n=1 Tax=Albugo laibachii Nc14 TaxID=890382 RepID=F0WCL2_9STRA|nr:AlNc14C59G4392 [Albugo laibachii Nc14]|eukprot:CCA18929.1 AlNc14C59G4392 [Albugo laibachii Nc14]